VLVSASVPVRWSGGPAELRDDVVRLLEAARSPSYVREHGHERHGPGACAPWSGPTRSSAPVGRRRAGSCRRVRPTPLEALEVTRRGARFVAGGPKRSLSLSPVGWPRLGPGSRGGQGQPRVSAGDAGQLHLTTSPNGRSPDVRRHSPAACSSTTSCGPATPAPSPCSRSR
jgi:hypothetical protein